MSPPVLRVLTYNIQVAIGSRRFRHYVSHGWKYVMPHGQTRPNLERIAGVIADYDVVGLQEADGGSIRTGFVDQARYLADRMAFDECRSLITRDLGRFAQHTNSLLARLPLSAVTEHRLPGAMDGRGALEARLELDGLPLTVVVTHLALGRRTRLHQSAKLAEIIKDAGPCLLMGDFNCKPHSPELTLLRDEADLHLPVTYAHATLPSWRPRAAVDHILTTPDLTVDSYGPLVDQVFSDHLPVAAEVRWAS
jgi:endonuclease/exonuclease/phosphatase family metal-dependent hydrolase